MKSNRSIAAALVAAMLCGCAAGAKTPSLLPVAPERVNAGTPQSDARHGAGKLVLRIRVPKRHRRARYISPATQGITIALTGPTNVSETASLQPNASGCTSTLAGTSCTLTIPGLKPCPSSANCYSGAVATYDAVSCNATCTIPPTAQELSANQSVAFTLSTGQSSVVGITLYGIAASVVILPDASSSIYGSSSGYMLSKCTGPQP